MSIATNNDNHNWKKINKIFSTIGFTTFILYRTFPSAQLGITSIIQFFRRTKICIELASKWI